mgnify:CR=1 FL=1
MSNSCAIKVSKSSETHCVLHICHVKVYSVSLNHWFLTSVPRNYELFFFIIITTLKEFYNIFQNIKFKYI